MTGNIHASCGCVVGDPNDLVQVRYGIEECDAITGFHPAVVHASYCPACAEKAKDWPEYIPEGVDDDWWFKVGYGLWRTGQL